MQDITILAQQAGATLTAAMPAIQAATNVIQHGYQVILDLMPLITLLMFLIIVRWNRQMQAIIKKQEQQNRTLIKLLNLHPDSEYQQYLRKVEGRTKEREFREAVRERTSVPFS